MKAEVSDQFNLLVSAVDILQKNLKCVICLELLQNPVKTRCRHSFCQCCINAVLKAASNALCPLCNTHITRRSLDNDVKSATLVTLYKTIIIAIEKDCGINVESYTIIERDTCEAIFNSPRHKKLSEKKPEDPKPFTLADGSTPLLPITSENNTAVTEKPVEENKDTNITHSETPKRTLSLENVKQKRGNVMNRYSKSYKSKHDSNAAPGLAVKKLGGVSCKDKVEHWLQINSGLLEKGFNSPVSNTPEVIPNFSPVDDDDLISASQVVETDAFHVPENTQKLNTKFKSNDQVDFKNDPYIFIPSQPTKNTKSTKRISTTSRKGRKISEKIIPTSKSKNVAIGDVTLNNIFCQQIPESQNIADGCNVTINDTFDNLIKDSKCSDKSHKINLDLDEVVLFKTPLDPANVKNFSDNVAVSSDDCPVDSRNQVGKSAVARSHGHRKSAVSRKSTLQKKSQRNGTKSECLKNINDTLELLKCEFDEVDKYKLVTSSQFDREQESIKNMEESASFQTKDQLFDKSEKGKLCEVNKNNKSVPEGNGSETDVDLKSPGWTRFLEVKKDFRKCSRQSLKALNVSGGSLLSSKNTAVFNEDNSEEQAHTRSAAIFNDEVTSMLVRNRSSSEESLYSSVTHGNPKQTSEETFDLRHQSTNMNIYENDICDLETVIFQKKDFVDDVSAALNKTSSGLPLENNFNEKQKLLNVHLQNASRNSDESFGPVTHFETPSNSQVQNCVKNALLCLETINLDDCSESMHSAISSLKSELQRKETMILHTNMERDTLIKELDVDENNSATNMVCSNNEVESNPQKVCTSKNNTQTITQNIKDININEKERNSNVVEVVESTPLHSIIFPEEFGNVDHTKRLPSVNVQTSDDNSLNLTIKFNLNLNDVLRNKNLQFDELNTCNKAGLSKSRKTFSLLANTEDINKLSAIDSSESMQDHFSHHVENTSRHETHNYKCKNVATQTHPNGLKPHCMAELSFGSMSSAIPVNIDSTINVSQTNKGLQNIQANFWFSYEDHIEKHPSGNKNSESQNLSHIANKGTALTMQEGIPEESQEIEKSALHKFGNLYTLTNSNQPVQLCSNQNNSNNITKSPENYSQSRKTNGKSVDGELKCTSKVDYNKNEDCPQLLGTVCSNTKNVKEAYSSTIYLPLNSIDVNLSKKVESIQEERESISIPASFINQVQNLPKTSQTEQVLLTASSFSNGQGLVFPCGQITADSQISNENKQCEEISFSGNEVNLDKGSNYSMSLFSSTNTDDKSGKGRQVNVETSKEKNPSYESRKSTVSKNTSKQDALNSPLSNTIKRPLCMSDDDEIRPNKKRNLKNVLCSDSEESSSEPENKVACYPKKQLNTPIHPSSQNTEDFLNSEEIIEKVMAKIDEELGLAASHQNSKEKRSPSSPKRRKLSQPKSPSMFSQPGNAGEDEINDKATLHISVNDGDLSSQTRNKLHFTEEKKLLPFHQDSVPEEISVSIPESDDDIVERTPTKVTDATLRDHGSSDKENLVHDNIQICDKNSFKERKLNSNLLQRQEEIKIGYKPSASHENTSKSNINGHNESVSLLHNNINNSKLNLAVSKNEIQETLVKKPSDLIIMCSGFSRDMPAKIKNAVVALGAVFSEKFLPTATHLIAKTNEQNCTDKTLKYLQAVAAGKWIVNIEWIKTCVRLNKIVPEAGWLLSLANCN